MRWLLPAMAVSFGLHAALLGVVGGQDNAMPGSDAMVTGTVIVFDTPPAPAVSAADAGDNDQSAVATDSSPEQDNPVSDPDPDLSATPDDTQVAEPPVENVEPSGPVTEPAELRLQEVQEQMQAARDELIRSQEEAAEKAAAQRDAEAAIEAAAIARATAEAARKAEADRKAEASRKAEADRKARQKDAAARARDDTAAKAKATTKATRSSKKESTAGKPGQQASAGRKGGASAGDRRAYASRVLSHIQRFKRYPSGTSASGVVRLAVRISGSGSISGASVNRSSGNPVLDRAAVATARAASPYPAPPGGSAFSFTVSLRFTR